MLKKIRQKLADIRNKFRPGKKISEGIENDALDRPESSEEVLSPFDQLVRNSQQQISSPTALADKTGEVLVPQEINDSVSPPIPSEEPIALDIPALQTSETPIPQVAPVVMETAASNEIAEKSNSTEIPDLDKTPVPKFDTITASIPRFDSLPSNSFSLSDDDSDASSDPNTFDLDSSRPLYKIPKKTRLPFLTTPLAKMRDLFLSMFKGIFRRIKKDRPDLFQGSESGAKLNVNKLYEIIFSPESRPYIHQGFIVLLVVFFSFAVGKTIALVLRGRDTVSVAKARSIDIGPLNKDLDLNVIRIANLFNAHDISAIKKNRSQENVPCTLAQAESPSSLPIKVLNTIVLQDSVKSLAAVQVRSRPTLMEFREGEKIENIAKLDKIDRLKIVIRNLESDQCEYLSNMTENARGALQVMSPHQAKTYAQSKPNPDIINEGNHFQIKKRYLNEKLKDIGLVLTQAKAVKITNPDGSLAFKMTEVDPGGPFASLNVHVDDTITSVNGKKFTSMNEVMDLFGKVKDMEKLSITVLREGEEQVMEYNFTN
ncbi:MAG: PDZ domain-containing protein [Bacteriovoracaceae bacterium]